MNQSGMKSYLMIILGTTLFTLSVNLLIAPLHLYNTGLLGFAQVLRTVLVEQAHLDVSFDIAGIINFMFNLPLFLLAYRSISKHFVIGTFVSIVLQTVLFSIIPIPAVPLIEDTLASLLLGAALGAFGCGMCLTAEASAGGSDILGMYLSIRFKTMSVGKLTIYLNAVLYAICAVMFNLPTAIYSIIYAIFFGIVVDKVHLQNIETSVMIFTKQPNLAEGILNDFHRGVTMWKGTGAYTNEDTDILVTVISKYELDRLKHYLKEKDPHAFIIVQEGLQVSGGFEKRLVR